MKRHYRRQFQVVRNSVVSLFSIGFGVYFIRTESLIWLGWLLVGMGGILIAMLGYALLILPLLIYETQLKLKDRYDLCFSEEGIQFETDKINSNLQWSLYDSWQFDDEFYILFYGKRELTVVPRRVLDETSDRYLHALLTQQLGEPKFVSQA